MKADIEYQAELKEKRGLEQLAMERREQERQALAERQKRQEMERQREANVVIAAESWERAAIAHEYAKAVRTGMTDTSLTDERRAALDAWLKWAEQVEDAMNPLPSRIASAGLDTP